MDISSMMGPICQSCGMPLSMDKNSGGTQNDGSKSKEYCSNCYQNGEFIEKDLTLEEVKETIKKTMLDMKQPQSIIDMVLPMTDNLKRWSK